MSKAPLSIDIGGVRIKRSRSFLNPPPHSEGPSLEESEIHVDPQRDEYFHKSPGLGSIGRGCSHEVQNDFIDASAKEDEQDIGNDGTVKDVEDYVQAEQLPVIDLADVDKDDGQSKLLAEIRAACQTWGFFQIINHGVPADLVERFLQVSKQFFELSDEEKMEYNTSKLANRVIYKPKEATETRNLENLTILSFPLPEADVNGNWPSQPLNFRETIEEYNFETVLLQNRVLALISESLSLDCTYIEESNGDTRVVLMLNNYHARASDIDGGIRAQSDPHTITMLLQDGAGGFQVLKDNYWVEIQPLPNSFLVNVGDLLQILSNGTYKSAEYRAVIRDDTSRLSIVSCRTPADGHPIAPAPPLTVETPPKYSAVMYKDHLRRLLSTGLNGRRYLDAIEIESSCKS